MNKNRYILSFFAEAVPSCGKVLPIVCVLIAAPGYGVAGSEQVNATTIDDFSKLKANIFGLLATFSPPHSTQDDLEKTFETHYSIEAKKSVLADSYTAFNDPKYLASGSFRSLNYYSFVALGSGDKVGKVVKYSGGFDRISKDDKSFVCIGLDEIESQLTAQKWTWDENPHSTEYAIYAYRNDLVFTAFAPADVFALVPEFEPPRPPGYAVKTRNEACIGGFSIGLAVTGN